MINVKVATKQPCGSQSHRNLPSANIPRDLEERSVANKPRLLAAFAILAWASRANYEHLLPHDG